jgi:hypothetical protein
MSRTKGAKNKQIELPEIVGLQDKEKLEILANILLEIVFEEGENAGTNK